MDWFRWHHGSVTDPKFQLIARKAGASLPDVLAVWAFVLEKASGAAERGCFGVIDTEALDCLFNFPGTESRTADILRVFEERGLTKDGWIARWEERQPKREREGDNSTSRVQAHREKKRHETPSNANQSHETPRLEKKREEEREDIVSADAEKPSRKKPKTRLPEDFAPNATGVDLCSQAGLNLAEELGKFRNHHTAQGSLMADWQAGFRTWIDKAKTFRKPQASPTSTVPGSPGRDPALVKIEEDARKAVGPSLETLERMAQLRKGVVQ